MWILFNIWELDGNLKLGVQGKSAEQLQEQQQSMAQVSISAVILPWWCTAKHPAYPVEWKSSFLVSSNYNSVPRLNNP